MKKLIISTTTFLLTISAWGKPDSELLKTVLEKQSTCQSFVRYDDNNIYLGFGAYRLDLDDDRKPVPGTLRIAPLDGSATVGLSLEDSPIDVISNDAKAYVLTYTNILEIDLAKKSIIAEYKTHFYNKILQNKEHAEAMARYKNKIIIAHGRLGVSFFDINTKRITQQYNLVSSQRPLESMAVGVTVQGQYAFVAMDNFSLVPPDQKQAFRGIVIINMETEKVISQLGGMDPGSDSILSDSKKLIVSFMGQPIWKYSIENLKGSMLPAPDIRIWKFPIKGHPTGAPAMDEKYYYTCFSKHPEQAGEPVKRIPVALNRKQLILD